jgi:hypothetical protein
LDVGQLMGTLGSKDISSALRISSGTRNANAAVMGENGSFRLTFVP